MLRWGLVGSFPSNDPTELTVRTRLPGRRLEDDFGAVHFSAAEHEPGATGCSVFHFPSSGVSFNLDVRGGSVGIVGDYGYTQAICLAGGSLLGLEATAGVAAELLARGEYRTECSAPDFGEPTESQGTGTQGLPAVCGEPLCCLGSGF